MQQLKCLIIIFCFTSMQVAFADSISASVDANMAAQRAACDKNTSMEWSSKLSRCIGKQAAVDARNAVNNCDTLTDLTAKEKCQMAIAEKSTAMSSDTSKLNQGGTTGSMVMNTATTVYSAYAATNLIQEHAKTGANSNCMSKKILGVTAIAGLASDVYLKVTAKKKVKELEGKYKLALTNTAYEAQVKALEYLKEEQQTVVSIAGMEKKRNMVMILGYALATGWAVYEMTPLGANPDCIPADEDKTQTAQANADAPPLKSAANTVKEAPDTIKEIIGTPGKLLELVK